MADNLTLRDKCGAMLSAALGIRLAAEALRLSVADERAQETDTVENVLTTAATVLDGMADKAEARAKELFMELDVEEQAAKVKH